MLKVTELMINDCVRINGSDFRVREIKKKGAQYVFRRMK